MAYIKKWSDGGWRIDFEDGELEFELDLRKDELTESNEWIQLNYFFVIWRNIVPSCEEARFSTKNENICVLLDQNIIGAEKTIHNLKNDCLLQDIEIASGSFDECFGLQLNSDYDWLEFKEDDGRCYVRYKNETK